MATIFNEYFASIGTRLANRLRSLTTVTTRAISSTRNWFNSNMIPKFELQPVCEQFVYDLLRQLKVNEAIGLDEISPRLLKDSAHVITPSLTRLFNCLWPIKRSHLFGKRVKYHQYLNLVIGAIPTIIGR